MRKTSRAALTLERKITMRRLSLAIVGLTFLAAAAEAQESGGADVAKQAQNPLANIISLPFQSNTDFGLGPRVS